MKNIPLTPVLLCVFLAFLLGREMSSAGEKKISKKNIPPAVMKAFQSAYPNAKIKGQAVETENKIKYYEIESVDGKLHRDLLYTADGTVKEIEESMDLNALPAEMKGTLEKEYPKGKIVKAERVTRDSVTTYEFQIKVGKKLKGVSLDASGKILKPAKGPAEEEEEKEENEEEDKD